MLARLLTSFLFAFPASASTVVPPSLLWCDWAESSATTLRVTLLEGTIERKVKTLDASTLSVGTHEIQFNKTDRALRLTGIRLTCESDGADGTHSVAITQKWATHFETSEIGDVIRLKIVIVGSDPGQRMVIIPSE